MGTRGGVNGYLGLAATFSGITNTEKHLSDKLPQVVHTPTQSSSCLSITGRACFESHEALSLHNRIISIIFNWFTWPDPCRKICYANHLQERNPQFKKQRPKYPFSIEYRLPGFYFRDFFHQNRDDLEQIPDNSIVSHVENGCLRILVDCKD